MNKRKRLVVAAGLLLVVAVSVLIGVMIARQKAKPVKKTTKTDPIYAEMQPKKTVVPAQLTTIDQINSAYVQKNYSKSLELSKAYVAKSKDNEGTLSVAIICVDSAKRLKKQTEIDSCKQKAQTIIAGLTDQAAKDGWTTRLNQVLGLSNANMQKVNNENGPQ